MNVQQNKDQKEPFVEDWLETYASDVQDGSIAVKDTIDKLVEGLREGKPADPKDIEEVKWEMQKVQDGLKELKDELNKLP